MSQEKIIEELKTAYAMELETLQNYLAASVNLDGVRAKIVKEELKDDIGTELGHAQRLAERIKILGGIVPGSFDLERNQRSMQPTKETADLIRMIKAVIEAEEGAIAQYAKLIKLCDGVDYVTQDLCIELLGEEEEHRRDFIGFLKEFEESTEQSAIRRTA